MLARLRPLREHLDEWYLTGNGHGNSRKTLDMCDPYSMYGLGVHERADDRQVAETEQALDRAVGQLQLLVLEANVKDRASSSSSSSSSSSKRKGRSLSSNSRRSSTPNTPQLNSTDEFDSSTPPLVALDLAASPPHVDDSFPSDSVLSEEDKRLLDALSLLDSTASTSAKGGDELPAAKRKRRSWQAFRS